MTLKRRRLDRLGPAGRAARAAGWVGALAGLALLVGGWLGRLEREEVQATSLGGDGSDLQSHPEADKRARVAMPADSTAPAPDPGEAGVVKERWVTLVESLPEVAQAPVIWLHQCQDGAVYARSAILDRIEETRRHPPSVSQQEWEREEGARIANPPWDDRLCLVLTDHGLGASSGLMECPDSRRIEVRHYPSRREYREWCGMEQVGELTNVQADDGVYVWRDVL